MATVNSPTTPMQNLPNQATQLQLHDIHLPEQVSNYPIAPGWWLLLTLIILIAVWSYKVFNKNKRLNSSKKQALAILANNPSLPAKECISLLKWAAMQYGNRQQLAKLYGESFQYFLIQQLPEKYQANFTALSTAAFAQQYQAEQALLADAALKEATPDSDCYQATKLWLTHALPIKKPTPIEKEQEQSA